MFHFVYCTENLQNKMIYVGKHSTTNLDDGCLGSGVLISKAIQTFGKHNFERHVLAFFSSSEEAFSFEERLVDESVVFDENTYNVIVGGGCDWDSINQNVEFRKEKNRRAAQAMNAKMWADQEFRKRKTEQFTNIVKQLHVEGKVRAPDWTGRKHRDDSKRAIGGANIVTQSGHRNSNFGKIWVSHFELKISKCISKDEFESYLEQGWLKGRRMKWK